MLSEAGSCCSLSRPPFPSNPSLPPLDSIARVMQRGGGLGANICCGRIPGLAELRFAPPSKEFASSSMPTLASRALAAGVFSTISITVDSFVTEASVTYRDFSIILVCGAESYIFDSSISRFLFFRRELLARLPSFLFFLQHSLERREEERCSASDF
jgi:hypothetical protein